MASFPFLLGMVLQEMFVTELQTTQGEDAEILSKVRNSFYVDNLLMSVNTELEVEGIYNCSCYNFYPKHFFQKCIGIDSLPKQRFNSLWHA